MLDHGAALLPLARGQRRGPHRLAYKLLQRSTERSSFHAKITFTDLLTKVVAAALARHPRVNASWRDGAIVAGSGIHVGLAIAVEGGLVVPVIHHADRLGVGELARQRQELMARAQAGKLRLEDLADGTFTISNLGMYGVDAFNAIVNPPQAAILAVGRIADRVVAVNGQPAVRPTLIAEPVVRPSCGGWRPRRSLPGYARRPDRGASRHPAVGKRKIR